MRLLLQVTLLILALFTYQGAIADNAADIAKIQGVLKQQFPDLKVDSVAPSPVAGLFQVNAGAMVLYVSNNGRYAFSGDIIDLEGAHANITENVRKLARLKELKSLNQASIIQIGPKNPKYIVTVFTDVDCGYCRKMQSEMKTINDMGIAIRYLPFPRTGPNTPTYEKMAQVWCAKDKKQAIDLAKKGKPLDSKVCSHNGLEKAFQAGLSMGVAGTPTLVFEDGTLVPGYLAPEKLLEVAEQLAKKQS